MIDAVATFGLLEALALKGVRDALDDRRPVWLVDLDSDTILFMNAGAAGLMDRQAAAGLDPIHESGLARQIIGRMSGDGLEVLHLRSQAAPGPTPVRFEKMADARFPDAVWVTGLRPATRDSDMNRLWDALLSRINLEGAKVMLVTSAGDEVEALGIDRDLKAAVLGALDLAALASADRVGSVSLPLDAGRYEGVAYPVSHRAGRAVLIVGDIYPETAVADMAPPSADTEVPDLDAIEIAALVGERFSFDVDSRGRITTSSPLLRKLLGGGGAPGGADSIDVILGGKDLVVQSQLAAALAAEDTWSDVKCAFDLPEGMVARTALNGIPIFQPAGHLRGYRSFGVIEAIEDAGVHEAADETDTVPVDVAAPEPTPTNAPAAGSWLAALFSDDAPSAQPETCPSEHDALAAADEPTGTVVPTGDSQATEYDRFDPSHTVDDEPYVPPDAGDDHTIDLNVADDPGSVADRGDVTEPDETADADADTDGHRTLSASDMDGDADKVVHIHQPLSANDLPAEHGPEPTPVERRRSDDGTLRPIMATDRFHGHAEHENGLDEEERQALADIAATIQTAFGDDSGPLDSDTTHQLSDAQGGDDDTDEDTPDDASVDDPFLAELGDYRKDTSPPTPESRALKDDLEEDLTPISDRRALARLIAGNISPGEQAALLDRLPLGLMIYHDDEVIFANRAVLEILGYADVEMLKTAGGLDAVFDASQLATHGHENRDTRPIRARRQDGQAVDVIAHMQVIPWSGETAILLSVRNVPPATLELHDGDGDTRVSELNSILDIATDGIVVIDADGFIERMNSGAEALFGYASGEKEGEQFTDLFTPSTRNEAAIYMEELAQYGVASVLNDGREVRALVKQGGEIPVFLTVGRISTGPDAKFCAVMRDIGPWKSTETELIQARKRAEDASAHKSDFLAKISHEIRTPLNAIIGFSEVIMEERFGPVGNARYKEYIQDIHAGGRHLLSLINDLLDLSKIEAGKMDFSFTSVNLNDLVQECAMIMQPDANRERIIVRTNLPANVPPVVADSRSLKQILLNVLSNGVKFTQAGGQVIASTRLDENGEVSLTIRDTGIGMSDDEIETALEPFRQISTSKKTGAGTGLGLPLTKALVEANRANFNIESEPESGTTVRVVFPVTRVLAE